MYRIYIQDGDERLWLTDWIVSAGIDHPQFSTRFDHAMIFQRFDAAHRYVALLRDMGYAPHIH